MVQHAGTREQARTPRPITIDLTDTQAPVVDEEYVVEWQISEPGLRAPEDAPVAPSRA